MDPTTHDELIALLPRLRRFAYGLTGSLDEGDDLVQSACERALSRLHQWQPGTRLDSWMYRIVQTTWIDRKRSERRRARPVDIDELKGIAGGDLAQETEARLHLGKVQRFVDALPAEQRAVLLLVTVEGLSYREAAELLDVPIGTIMSRLARARMALGRALGTVAAAVPAKEAGHASSGTR